MSESPRGGLFQDESWEFRGLFGCPIKRLVGHLDENGKPLVFFLEPDGLFWQRFYLDAGLGFWGEYDAEEIADELEGEPIVDYGERFGIVGELLGVVRCESRPRIRIAVASGEIVFETEDPSDIQAPAKAPYFRPKSPN